MGSLRVEVVSATAPLVTDVVVTGADRAYVGVLVWLNVAACQQRFGPLPVSELVRHAPLHDALCSALQQHNQHHTGSSMRIQAALLLESPASMDAGEVTDKGYVNQRAVLARRASDVEALYGQTLIDTVIDISATTHP